MVLVSIGIKFGEFFQKWEKLAKTALVRKKIPQVLGGPKSNKFRPPKDHWL